MAERIHEHARGHHACMCTILAALMRLSVSQSANHHSCPQTPCMHATKHTDWQACRQASACNQAGREGRPEHATHPVVQRHLLHLVEARAEGGFLQVEGRDAHGCSALITPRTVERASHTHTQRGRSAARQAASLCTRHPAPARGRGCRAADAPTTRCNSDIPSDRHARAVALLDAQRDSRVVERVRRKRGRLTARSVWVSGPPAPPAASESPSSAQLGLDRNPKKA
eukprot:364337-Chlamydomonas_euryale.AAC.19